MTARLQGVSASGGIAIGPVVVHRPEVPDVPNRHVEDRQAEKGRLEDAVRVVMGRLEALEAHAGEQAGMDTGEIFVAHRMFLEDPSFAGAAAGIVIDEGLSAEAAVSRVTEKLASEFEEIGDDYFAQRAGDLRDIGAQLVRELMGLGDTGLTRLAQPSIIVAHDLTPSETVTIPEGMVLGFVTSVGSATSHTAILARGMGIPAVVGVGESDIPDGSAVAMDGDAGTVWVDPDEDTLAELEAVKLSQDAIRQEAEARASEPAVTLDGRRVEVVANVGSGADAARADELGAEGVGLFRTEFLFIDRGRAPDEQEQLDAYRQVFEVFGDRPVVVRTLDVGGDKNVPGIDVGEELNPFMGNRGIRLTLGQPGMFRTQLRALLRAAVGANLKLMFPMIASRSEIDDARAAVDEAAASLDAEGIERVSEFELGIMVEIPSAAITADLLAPHVDFFSIGTNDLTQYTLAVDRTNPAVAAMADSLHPAVLRLIGRVIDAAHDHGRWVGLCGELAGEPLAAPVLLGLGLDEWSMNPPAVPLVKAKLRTLSADACVETARACLAASSPEEVRAILAQHA